MIDYATREIDVLTNDMKKTFKYPYNSCELLCSDSSYITDKFFQETIIYSNGSEQLINEEEQIITNDDDDDINEINSEKKLSGISQYKMLEHFLSFVNCESIENDVLCGYFSRIFIKLIKCQGLFILNFLFNEGKTFLNQLISKLEHDSICQCIYNLLIYNSKSEMIQIKKVKLFQMIAEQLLIEDNKNIVSICDMLTNVFCHEQFILFFFEHIDLLNAFSPIIISIHHNHKIYLLKLIIQIIETISKYLATNNIATEIIANNLQIVNLYEYNPYSYLSEKNSLSLKIKESIQIRIYTILDIISQLCLLYLPERENPLIIDSNINTITNTLGIIQVRLGNEKLLIVALIRSLLILFHQSPIYNETIKQTIKGLSKRNIGTFMIIIYFNFELCNVFHNYFLDIIKIILSNTIFDLLIHELLDESRGNLISKLISLLSSKTKMFYISDNVSTSCLFASVISIADVLYKSTNKTVLFYSSQNPEFHLIHKEMISKIIDIFNGFLLYDNNEIITNEENEPQEEYHPKISNSQYSIQNIIEHGVNKIKEYQTLINHTENHLHYVNEDSSHDFNIAMVYSHNDIVQIQDDNLILRNNNNLNNNEYEYEDHVYWKPAITFKKNQEKEWLCELLNEGTL